jgi:hypothetical protein
MDSQAILLMYSSIKTEPWRKVSQDLTPCLRLLKVTCSIKDLYNSFRYSCKGQVPRSAELYR